MPRLQTHDVTVRFGGATAVNDVSLSADEARITGLIGPNGAGKTTTFNVITGLQSPTSGKVTLDGEDVTALPVHARARLGVARTFQRLELFGSLTVRENILVAAEAHRRQSRPRRDPKRVDTDKLAQDILTRVGIRDVADVPSNRLPTGLARLTELGRALAIQPRLLLLDELSMGPAPLVVAELYEVLKGLAADGTTVLLVEQFAHTALAIADYVAVMVHGTVQAVGEPADLEDVAGAYLGAGV